MKGTMKKLNACLWLLAATGLLSAQAADGGIHADLSTGQVLYVPVYSHIYQGDRESPVYLAVTLSIRNVDPQRPIEVLSADYHDSKAQLLKKYQEGPVQLPPASSIRYVIQESDKAGGSGAFFMVAWRSDRPVNPPILESVMIGTKSQQGISFTSRGRVVAEGTLEKAPMAEHEKILRMAEEWVPALTSGDIERNMAFFAADVVIAGGGRDEIYVGPNRVHELLAHHLKGYNVTDSSLRVRAVTVEKDWAELRGAFKAVWKPKKEGVAEEKEFSNYIWVLKKQTDGSWKIARFLFYPAE
jgi:ketosteroid isomerase-like protein